MDQEALLARIAAGNVKRKAAYEYPPEQIRTQTSRPHYPGRSQQPRQAPTAQYQGQASPYTAQSVPTRRGASRSRR